MNEANVERVARAIKVGAEEDESLDHLSLTLAQADNLANRAIGAYLDGMPPAWPPMRPMSEAPQDGTRILALIVRSRSSRPHAEIIVRWDASASAWRGDDRSLWETRELAGWYPLPPIGLGESA